MNEIFIWILILIFLSQSAIFSGMTIGAFGLGRLRLEIEAEAGNEDAIKILQIRRDSNFLLTTLLWGNVGVNVMIALLTSGLLFPKCSIIGSKVDPSNPLLPDAALSGSQAYSAYS